MEQKSWVAVAVLAAFVIIGVAIVSTTGTKKQVNVQPMDVDESLVVEEQPIMESSEDERVEETMATTTPASPATSTTTVEAATPAQPAASAPAASTFTLAQVGAHATASDCWTAVRGNVYNVTPFVSRHPGGVEAIVQVCGRDGTAFFEGQHGGQKTPESVLASLKVGVLAQ